MPDICPCCLRSLEGGQHTDPADRNFCIMVAMLDGLADAAHEEADRD